MEFLKKHKKKVLAAAALVPLVAMLLVGDASLEATMRAVAPLVLSLIGS